MDPALLDPSLHSPTEDSVDSPTTNGVSASSLASCPPPAANPSHPPPRLQFSKLQITSWPLSNYAPQRDAGESRAVYEQRLTLVTRKAPLLEACKRLHLKANKSSNLVALRQELAKYWFSQASSRHLASSSHNPPSSVNPNDVLNFYPPPDPIHLPPPAGLLPTVSHTTRGEFRGAVPLFHINPAASTASSSRATANPSSGSRSTTLNAVRRNTATAAPSQASTNTVSQPASSQTRAPASAISRHARTTDEDEPEDGDDGDDDEELIRQYGVEGANADELLGYDDDDEEEDGEEEEDGDASNTDIADEAAAHAAFKRSVRIQAVNRAEGNRRAGGIKTQNAVKKDFQEWQAMARERGKIKDHIIDEHALLLYINFSAEREKKTRRGVPIPNSRLGASQLKKLFFGVLRIRKVQDAADPTLLQRRPATTFVVWEGIKCRMDEALERVRNGLGENEEEDAPDIRANTFLPEITEEQLKAVGYGFLAHRQLRLVIFGHLAWTSQHASGNRGDDFRALKISELQPYTMPHPDGRTAVPCLLGLQGEEKAGRRGMRTIVNPSYSVFVAHKNPEVCSMGAFAFYHHWIHDVLNVTEKLKVDWAWNKSWRQARVLHGPNSPNTPYSEQALYNLYCRAFQHANFNSRMKAHLPRHLLGYKQEAMNVDSADTAQLGWVRNVTYFDTYKPALPKHAILGAAGYKVDETYDPVWTRVHVPPQFLLLICPDAERIRDEIANRENLSGAFNYWQMIIDMRPYAFQLPQVRAISNEDVINWMKTTFPEELTLLHAQAGDPADLLLVQNNVLRKALEDLFKICTSSDTKLVRLTALLERRTSALSPAQGFSTTAYHRNALAFSSSPSTPPRGSARATHSSPITIHFDSEMHETGTYESTGDDGSSNHRAFVNTSPRSSDDLRVPTEVDLVLPPTEAFYKPGGPRGVVPPLFGQKSAQWPEVFALVQQPKFCWDVWGPKSVDRYRDVNEIWTSWIDGEAVSNAAGTQTGKKPPLKYVEQYLQNRWRTSDDQKARTANAQHWSRYREIPEWIERESSRRGVPPSTIVDELEGTRVVGNITKGINWLRKEVEGLRKAAKTASNPVDAATPSTASSPDPETTTLGQPFEEDTSKRKRAAPVDSRRTKKAKHSITLRMIWAGLKPPCETGGYSALLPLRQLSNSMGSPKLWQILDDAASSRSLLNLTTLDAFKLNNRRLRTLLLGVDISIKLSAIEAALKKAGVLHPGIPGQKLILEKFFYYLCNLLLACVVPIFVTDGPGRPSEKRGVKVIHRQKWLIEHVKTMITAFGFYFYDAPGEAEAQLAWLNQQGYIDAVLTEDSDALIFGAQCVIRTRGPHVEELALVYSMDSIEHTATVGLDQAGLLLCALLLGGDYAPGVTGIGPATARALARQGFGRELVRIMNLSVGNKRLKNLAVWRTALRGELRTNSSSMLAKRLPDAADNISDAFPNLDVVNLYLHPFICTSLEYSGPMPDCSSWRPRDPVIPLIADFCSSTFRWEGITFRMISSPLVLYDKVNDLFASPGTGGAVMTIRDAAPGYAQNTDLAPLDVKRIRISTASYVSCPQLAGLPALPNSDIKLVSIPKIILAVAMRDTALVETNLTHIPGGVAEYDESIELEVLDSDEEELVSAHSKLASQGVIDLTGDDL
ncbi:hypothetical protein R3P38DRAFT_3277089 [Favolaschia claudopus]|uniref:XPG-I domain-containing protein n=1 Tax=Favolaschia claudopus TaxID=2862362 RepID=A0AAW0API8_9AGAR